MAKQVSSQSSSSKTQLEQAWEELEQFFNENQYLTDTAKERFAYLEARLIQAAKRADVELPDPKTIPYYGYSFYGRIGVPICYTIPHPEIINPVNCPDWYATMRGCVAAAKQPITGRQDDGAGVSDPITLQQAAMLVQKERQTLYNNREGKPKAAILKRGSQMDVYCYSDLRPWLLEKFPESASFLPESYDDAMKLLDQMSSR